MDKFTKDLVRDITGVLVDLVPGGRLVRGTVQNAAVTLLDRKQRSAIEQAAKDIFESLYYSVGLDDRNPGAAKSAAYNVMDSVKKAKLTPQVLVDCCLDPELLYQRVSKYPATGIDGASALRQSMYDAGLRSFCEEVIAHAMELKPVQRLVYSRILMNQRQILAAMKRETPK